MNNPPGFYLIGPIYPARIGPFLPTNVGPFFPTLTPEGCSLYVHRHECFYLCKFQPIGIPIPILTDGTLILLRTVLPEIPDLTERPPYGRYHAPNSLSSLRWRHFMGLTGILDHELRQARGRSLIPFRFKRNERSGLPRQLFRFSGICSMN